MKHINEIPQQHDYQQEVIDKINARTGVKRNSNVPLVQRKKVKPLKMEEFFNKKPQPRCYRQRSKVSKRKKVEKLVVEDVDGPCSDDEDVEWITEENFHLLAESSWLIQQDPEDKSLSSVGVITTDYQIQNALYQLGIRILSVNGLSIHEIHQWALHCYSCFTMEKDTSKRFCSRCGNTTLQRVSIFLNRRGKVKYRFCNRNRRRKKGLIHPIPFPRSGRGPVNYIHSEDVYLKEVVKAKRVSRYIRKNEVDLDFGGTRWNLFDLPKVKAGTKDPNRVRPGSGNRKRRRRKKK